MDLSAITAFVAVGDCAGFRAAAAQLGVTSAGVSKAVARLEAQLGVMLVARTTRSVRLTTAGETFHARCKAILAELEHAGHEAAEAAAVPQGRLVVSASRTFGRLRVLPIVSHFVRLHRQVDVELRLTDRPVDLVADGVDLAVRIGDLPDSSLIAAKVASTGFVMSGSPDYLRSAGVPRHPDDLGDHEVVGYVAPETALRFPYRFLVDGALRTLNPSARLTIDDGEALVVAALEGAGLVMVNDYLVAEHLREGRLKRVLAEFELPPVAISAVHLPTRTPSAAATALVAMLRRGLARGS